MDSLPKSIRDTVELVGMAPAIELVKYYGGHPELKVPQVAEGLVWRRLVGVMGEEAATKFQAHFKGERFSVPKCDRALREERNRKIIADYDGEASMSTLVTRYNLTVRQLRNILSTVPGETVPGLDVKRGVDDRQMGLF